MKQFLSIFAAAMLGGMVTLGGSYVLNEKSDMKVAPQGVVQAKTVGQYNISPKFNVPTNFTSAAEKATPSVVHISTRKTKNKDSANAGSPFDFFFGGPLEGTGSGVIYTTDGYIITNNHVIEFADEVEVTLHDNRRFVAEVVGTDRKTDLAVLKIETAGLQALPLADSDAARIGEWILAVGNPFDLTSTVTAGIISAKGRSLKILKDSDAIESFIQTDAAVNPGNSGGALVDLKGNLLGINTAIATQTGSFQGYSFAIPINLAKRIVDDIIDYGTYQRAFLGVRIYDLDQARADELGVKISQGVVISDLENGGAAQYAGLEPLDIIVKVNDYNIRNIPDLSEIVGRSKVGDVLDVTINRKGKEMEIPVAMRAEPRD